MDGKFFIYPKYFNLVLVSIITSSFASFSQSYFENPLQSFSYPTTYKITKIDTFYHENREIQMLHIYDSTSLRKVISYYDNGKILSETNWIDNRFEGTSISWYPDGKLRTVILSWGVEGESIIYSHFPNGRLKSVSTGKINLGYKAEWCENGTLISETFPDSLRRMATFYFCNGKPFQEGTLVNNRFWDGEFKEFYFNGKLKEHGFYIQNSKNSEIEFIKNDTWKYFYDTGILERIEQYQYGIPHGTFIYYDQRGKVLRREEYQNGKRVMKK